MEALQNPIWGCCKTSASFLFSSQCGTFLRGTFFSEDFVVSAMPSPLAPTKSSISCESRAVHIAAVKAKAADRTLILLTLVHRTHGTQNTQKTQKSFFKTGPEGPLIAVVILSGQGLWLCQDRIIPTICAIRRCFEKCHRKILCCFVKFCVFCVLKDSVYSLGKS